MFFLVHRFHLNIHLSNSFSILFHCIQNRSGTKMMRTSFAATKCEWRVARWAENESRKAARTQSTQWKMCFNIRAQNFWHNFFHAQTTNVNVRLVRNDSRNRPRVLCATHLPFAKIHLFVWPFSTPRRCRQQNVFIFKLFIFFSRGAHYGTTADETLLFARHRALAEQQQN